ncbi:hypothetical protein CDAR_373391 [Caerostris darwini]|uniref:Uncharacterized protein n=1 Tax=Caerostris darwini TaxID=1538125 RepID=A0AAV4MZX6_9ARAC|nr:hypothetical protein CDAR_373391 [Caerostris darwini]
MALPVLHLGYCGIDNSIIHIPSNHCTNPKCSCHGSLTSADNYRLPDSDDAGIVWSERGRENGRIGRGNFKFDIPCRVCSTTTLRYPRNGREEGRNDGRKNRKKKGTTKARTEGWKEGRNRRNDGRKKERRKDGRKDGTKEGRKDGRNYGRMKGRND